MDDYPIFSNGGADSKETALDSSAGNFGDAYNFYATSRLPMKLEDAYRAAENWWLSDGTFRMAMKRVIRYFLTSVELKDVDTDERDKWEDFLENTLQLTTQAGLFGDDLMCYGNSYTSLYVPFRRMLICPKCNLHRPISKVQFKFEEFRFKGKCPLCNTDVEFKRLDRRTAEQNKIKIIRWNPHWIRVVYNKISHITDYFWTIDADIKRMITEGNLQYLESTPWEIIEACKQSQPMFHFAPGVIYHAKEETLAGIQNFGIGIPPIIANFKQGWLLQILRRYNEAIALDFIIPNRVISPEGHSGSVDPLIHQDLGGFVSAAMGMIRDRRKNPTAIHAFPYALKYTLIGGEGNTLAPRDLILAEEDSFLNGLGVPADFYRGTLQVQSAPTALRLFERIWTSYVDSQNAWLRWVIESCADLLNWERVSGRWQPVTLAEDIEKKQIQLQLASAMQISRQTAYAPFNIDYREEVHRMFEEEKFFQQEQERFQEEQQARQDTAQALQQAAQPPQQPGAGATDPNMGQLAAPQAAGAGAGAGGGAPPVAAAAAGGGSGITPEALSAQAEQIAYQLLAMPYETRRSQLMQIKQGNRELHALVTAKMQEIRQQAGSQGQQQIMQQMQSPAGGQQ